MEVLRMTEQSVECCVELAGVLSRPRNSGRLEHHGTSLSMRNKAFAIRGHFQDVRNVRAVVFTVEGESRRANQRRDLFQLAELLLNVHVVLGVHGYRDRRKR